MVSENRIPDWRNGAHDAVTRALSDPDLSPEEAAARIVTALREWCAREGVCRSDRQASKSATPRGRL